MTFCLLAPQPAYWHDNLFIGMTTCLLARQCEKSSMNKTTYTYTNIETRTMFTGTTIYHNILVTLWNYQNPYMKMYDKKLLHHLIGSAPLLPTLLRVDKMQAFMSTHIMYIFTTSSSIHHPHTPYALIWSYSIIGTPNEIT